MTKKFIIMEKAIELFAENGVESTTVQQITERCGISKGAFYLHFKSKDELILYIIDYFMSRMMSEIEQSVRNEKQSGNLLYTFLHALFQQFQKRIPFSKIFSKEEAFTFNKDFFQRLQMYSSLMNQMILDIIKRQFPTAKPELYPDLLFTITGFIKSYTELVIRSEIPIDIDYLCKTIVEKTALIAEHAKLPFIPPDFSGREYEKINLSKNQVGSFIMDAIQEQEEPIIRESLALLLEELENPNKNPAIIEGLLNNIRTNDQCKWVAYIYQTYLKKVSNNHASP